MFFSRSATKQRVITKYSIRAVLLTSILAASTGLYLYKTRYVPLLSKIQPPDHYGDLVAVDNKVVLKELPVDVYSGCRIARWGNAPVLKPNEDRDFTWDRGMRKALLKASVPLEVIADVVPRMAENNRHDEFIGMGNTYGISESGRVFSPSFTTTYKSNNRYAVCLNSQTNFLSNTQREYAKLFISNGWYIGEFLACGNVSVFHLAPKDWVVPVPSEVHDVSEPPTLALIGLLFFLLLIYKGTKRERL